jgi:hypothetical protein
MLLPEDDGSFVCKKCKWGTDDLFSYMEHFGVEYDWMVKLTARYNFNLYSFLEEMTQLIKEEDLQEAWGLLQSVTLMLINASGEDFEEFVEESEVILGTQSMFEQLERFMNDNETK